MVNGVAQQLKRRGNLVCRDPSPTTSQARNRFASHCEPRVWPPV
jgi:hypothetical protein